MNDIGTQTMNSPTPQPLTWALQLPNPGLKLLLYAIVFLLSIIVLWNFVSPFFAAPSYNDQFEVVVIKKKSILHALYKIFY